MNNMNNTKCASKRLPSRVRRSLVTRLIASTTSKALASSSRSGERRGARSPTNVGPAREVASEASSRSFVGILSDRDLLPHPAVYSKYAEINLAPGLRDEYNELAEKIDMLATSLMDQQVEELYAEEVLERAQALLSAFLTSKATHSQ